MADEKKQGEKTESSPSAPLGVTDSGNQPEESKAETAPAEKPKAEPKREETPVPAADKPTEEKTIDTSKLSKDALKIVEMVEKMSVLELAELVKVLEDKFGVSAAAPVPVAAAGGAGSAGQQNGGDEEKSKFNINVTSAGSNKIGVIKAVREVTTLGLKEAKDLVEALPKMVKEGVKKEEAEEIKKKLEAAGATVELQ